MFRTTFIPIKMDTISTIPIHLNTHQSRQFKTTEWRVGFKSNLKGGTPLIFIFLIVTLALILNFGPLTNTKHDKK